MENDNTNKNVSNGGWGTILQSESLAWSILIIMLIATFLTWYSTEVAIDQRSSDKFTNEVEDAVKLFESRLTEYEQLLRGGVSLLQTLPDSVDRKVWYEYVNGLEIETHFPGVQGVGFSKIIAPEELKQHENAIRAEGFPDYSVYPSGDREIYTSIIYLEPFDWRNKRAFGYDMFSEENRHQAMTRSRDAGLASMTKKVTLVQETKEDVQAGFLMYLPYYNNNKATRTTEERRQSINGYVYSPFRMNDFMSGILKTDNPSLDFIIYDDSKNRDASLLYDSYQALHKDKREALYSEQRIMNLYGQKWFVEFYSTLDFEIENESNISSMILITGLIIDTILFIILYFYIRNRKAIGKEIAIIKRDLEQRNSKLKIAQDSGGIGVWEYIPSEDLLIWDEKMYELYGVYPDSKPLKYSDWEERVHPDDKQQAISDFEKCCNDKAAFNSLFRILKGNTQEVCYLRGHARILLNAQGEIDRFIGVNFDVSKEKKILADLQLASTVYKEAIESILITDADDQIIDVNKSFIQKIGYSSESVKKFKPWDLFLECSPETRHEISDQLKKSGDWHGELLAISSDDKHFEVLVSISQIRTSDDEVSNHIYALQDISDLKSKQRQLEQLAHYDNLTNLPNRTLLEDRLSKALSNAKRNNSLMAICFFDLDGFKEINDKYGHNVGDLLLKRVAERLIELLRDSDSASRLGGDEFLLVLSNLESYEDIEKVIQRFFKALNASYVLSSEHVLDLTISMGVTVYPNDDSDIDTLIRHADQAMYVAKRSGKNSYKFYDSQ